MPLTWARLNKYQLLPPLLRVQRIYRAIFGSYKKKPFFFFFFLRIGRKVHVKDFPLHFLLKIIFLFLGVGLDKPLRNGDCFSHSRASACCIWDGVSLEGTSFSNTSKNGASYTVRVSLEFQPLTTMDIASAVYMISMAVKRAIDSL